MTYTPEQLAIRQHLSKPEPYNGGCGCLGPQVIDHNCRGERIQRFTFRIIEAPNRLLAMKAIRTCAPTMVGQFHTNYGGLTLTQAKAVMDAGELKFEESWQIKDLADALSKAGTKFEILEGPSGRYPVCPCAMKYVEEVEGNFYQINTHRTPDGITHTADLLGPVGGPYIIKKN